MTQNDLMTICSAFVRAEMGGTAGGGAAGEGQASRRPVMLQCILNAEWQRPRECIACSLEFLRSFKASKLQEYWVQCVFVIRDS